MLNFQINKYIEEITDIDPPVPIAPIKESNKMYALVPTIDVVSQLMAPMVKVSPKE